MQPNRGAVAKNKHKAFPDDPDYTGTGYFEGKTFWMSGWVKQNSDGTFLSFEFQAKETPTFPLPPEEHPANHKKDEK